MDTALALRRPVGLSALLGGEPSGRGSPPRTIRDERAGAGEAAGAGRRPEEATLRGDARSSGRGGRGSGPTLDDLLLDTWSRLSGHAVVTCPVCRGAMAPRYGTAPAPVGGRCRRCGSVLE